MADYPFEFANNSYKVTDNGDGNVDVQVKHVRGKYPTAGASRLREIMKEGREDPKKVAAICCSYDGLSSRQVEEAGFPFLFLSGYSAAAALGLPDTGYVGFQDLVLRIQEIARQVNIPMIADGDTGYGGLASVYRTVQGFAEAGAAGVMIEDQKWPKKCGHTRGKEVVDREEACARVKAACEARNNGKDIFILARTDALMVSFEEAVWRANEFTRLGADAIFVEAIPDREAMVKCINAIDNAVTANIIEGGKTELVSAKDLAEIGFAAAFYPLTLLSARIKATREALANLKNSFMTGPPPMNLPFTDVCEQVGFERYWEIENKYAPPKK